MNDEQDAAPPSHDASAPLTGGPPRPSPAIVSALRGEFRRLIEDGDLDDNLTKIEQLAARSRDLFIALKGAESKLIARAGHPYAMSSGGGNWGTSVAMQTAMPNVEQFGASAIRQVVDNLPEVAATVAEKIADVFTNAPARQVEAIATARRNGLDGLADRLEDRLLPPASAADEQGHHEHEERHGATLPAPALPMNGVSSQTNGSAVSGAGD